ncbi:hypothetical protein [Streptomyces sp. NPDC048623]|uniref:hypothetical protein n=1 Tax=Streptomyces sp. NPDC048623 TaxID=3155761 RepID=UPI0034313B74
MRPTETDVAREAVRELRDALRRVGVVLPSLGLDALTLAADPPRPLVELGRCTAATARLLAAALMAAALVNEGGRE